MSNITLRNRIIFLATVLVVVVAGALAITWVNSNSTSDDVPADLPVVQTQDNPAGSGMQLPVINLDGQWTAPGDNGGQFVATVTNNMISINIENDNMSMLYWNGSFETSVASGTTISSAKIETDELVMSGADSKDFVVRSNGISFEFKALGVTKTVVLTRA